MNVTRRTYRALTQVAKSSLQRRFPDHFGPRRHRRLLENYEVHNLITTDEGKVPMTWFTYRENFGDLLSPWLMTKMTGRPVTFADKSKPYYVLIGSIINTGTPRSIFWGTGTYGTEAKKEVCPTAQYTAVRGPLTRAKLAGALGFGIRVPAIYGDPALLAPLYYYPQVKPTYDYGVIVRWKERAWANAKYGPGVKLIDFSRTDIEGVITDMLSCKRLLSSSLHGLILADAYGIPSAWLASNTPRGGEYKFYDYFASVNKMRRSQEFNPAAQPVTRQVLARSFTFDGRPIDFNYRPLLDACPFMRRRPAH